MIDVSVEDSIVCIIEPCLDIIEEIFAEEIFTNSPESIFPKFSPDIVTKGSRVVSPDTILTATRSPIFNFEERSSLLGL